MPLIDQYRNAQHLKDVARLRRALSLRAMIATGQSQRQIAAQLGVSQPAISQQLGSAPDLKNVHPELLMEAAAPVLRSVAESSGYQDLAVFGSVARHQATRTSDIDLLVRQPPGTTITMLTRLRSLLEEILDRPVDLITYGGLKPGLDDDIKREAVLL